MSERTIALRGDHITLAQAVKVVGLADTGGQAKLLVREGTFTVNGEAATQPGRKLRVGDRFGISVPAQGEITRPRVIFQRALVIARLVEMQRQHWRKLIQAVGIQLLQRFADAAMLSAPIAFHQ